jgi:hypothetical protein
MLVCCLLVMIITSVVRSQRRCVMRRGYSFVSKPGPFMACSPAAAERPQQQFASRPEHAHRWAVRRRGLARKSFLFQPSGPCPNGPELCRLSLDSAHGPVLPTYAGLVSSRKPLPSQYQPSVYRPNSFSPLQPHGGKSEPMSGCWEKDVRGLKGKGNDGVRSRRRSPTFQIGRGILEHIKRPLASNSDPFDATQALASMVAPSRVAHDGGRPAPEQWQTCCTEETGTRDDPSKDGKDCSHECPAELESC